MTDSKNSKSEASSKAYIRKLIQEGEHALYYVSGVQCHPRPDKDGFYVLEIAATLENFRGHHQGQDESFCYQISALQLYQASQAIIQILQPTVQDQVLASLKRIEILLEEKQK